MNDDYEWDDIRPQDSNRFMEAGNGALRIALLFGGLAVALSLFVAPFLDADNDKALRLVRGGGVDPVLTGTVGANERTYTVRRSVLQADRTSTCIIRSDGSQTGAC